MLTCVIDADENRDVAIVDIPNAFVQTVVEDEKDRAFIRIRGPLVDILVALAPDVYREYVTIRKKGEKQSLVQCLNALYGTMVALLLYYKKFVKSLRSKRFKLNPYDPCVANKQVDGEQLTVCFHVDDCKISHISLERYSYEGYLIKVVVMALAGEVTRELSPILSWSNNNYEI